MVLVAPFWFGCLSTRPFEKAVGLALSVELSWLAARRATGGVTFCLRRTDDGLRTWIGRVRSGQRVAGQLAWLTESSPGA
jgi:hypothetical protein